MAMAPDTSLYEVLAQPAPHALSASETRITAAKETLDDDREDVSDDDVIYGLAD